MFTTVGWIQSVDPAAAYVALNALADQHVTVNGKDVIVPQVNKLVLAAAGLCTGGLGVARLDAPSIRDISRPFIDPVNVIAAADVTPQDPFRLSDRRLNPFTLSPGEALDAFIHSDPAAAHFQWVLAWLADNPITPVPSGAEIMEARFTGATALVADVWSNAPITFDDALPVGHYQVVGFRAESAGLIAARLVFKGYPWRPGCLGALSTAMYGHDVFRAGNLGVWGEFDSINQPSIDYLSITADAAESGILELVKTG